MSDFYGDIEVVHVQSEDCAEYVVEWDQVSKKETMDGCQINDSYGEKSLIVPLFKITPDVLRSFADHIEQYGPDPHPAYECHDKTTLVIGKNGKIKKPQ